MSLLFLVLLSLTFEEEKLIKFLEPVMLQTEGNIKIEKKFTGENFAIYYATKEGEEKGREEMVPCAIYERKNVIYGMYFGLKSDIKPIPEYLGPFLTSLFGSTIKVEKDQEIGKNLKSFKIYQETGYGKVKMMMYILADKHLFIGNYLSLNDKMDEIISNKLNWDLSGKIGSPSSKNKFAFFFDLECPHCKKVEKEIMPILKEKKDLLFGFFLFPLSTHILSFKGSAGAFCFKKIKEEYFLDYIDWFYEERSDMDVDNIDSKIFEYAKEKGIGEEFLNCYMKTENIKTVLEALQMGIDLNVQGTPTIFFNGKKYPARKIISMLKNEK